MGRNWLRPITTSPQNTTTDNLHFPAHCNHYLIQSVENLGRGHLATSCSHLGIKRRNAVCEKTNASGDSSCQDVLLRDCFQKGECARIRLRLACARYLKTENSFWLLAFGSWLNPRSMPSLRQFAGHSSTLRQSGMTWDDRPETHANLGCPMEGEGGSGGDREIADIARHRGIGEGKAYRGLARMNADQERLRARKSRRRGRLRSMSFI